MRIYWADFVGADPNAKDAHGKFAYEYAKDEKVIALLKQMTREDEQEDQEEHVRPSSKLRYKITQEIEKEYKLQK